MEILNLSLPATNRFATKYIAQHDEILKYFHYRYNKTSDYKVRYEELMRRSFNRLELANHIQEYMANFPGSRKVNESIEKLKKKNSAVIIGGQQAGILTGPLYTLNKIISIITLAKEKEEELGIPIVPVFWIAGEDHDYQEVNHVYIEKNNRMEKKIYPEKVHDKRMISDVQLNRELCFSWVKEIIESYGETEYTKELLHSMKIAVQHAKTFTDLFSYIIMSIFKDSGLLIIDSGDEKIRKLEKEVFFKQIINFKEITASVKRQQEILQKHGYTNTIEISERTANLFYYDEFQKERILLEYDEGEEVFIGKNGHIQFQKEVLLDIAGSLPERLSNNVVTRPLMQEELFPTLAFIAGPGEIAYWAELKQVFEYFGMKIPPIVPRLNITILDRSIETDMNDLGLDMQEVLTAGTESHKTEFLKSIKNKGLDELLQKTRHELKANYQLIEDYLVREDKGMLPLIKKNEALLFSQIEFLETKINNAIQFKHDVVIRKFERIGNALNPLGSPQERIWNGLFYINRYGQNFINDLLNCHFKFDGTHKVVKV